MMWYLFIMQIWSMNTNQITSYTLKKNKNIKVILKKISLFPEEINLANVFPFPFRKKKFIFCRCRWKIRKYDQKTSYCLPWVFCDFEECRVSVKILHKYKAGRDMAKHSSQSSLVPVLTAMFLHLNTRLLNLLKIQDWNWHCVPLDQVHEMKW